MKFYCLTIWLLTAASALYAQQAAAPTGPLSIGEIRTLHSGILHEDRTLNIYLPQGYDAAKTYPVIYLLDGSIDEDFIHITGLVQFFNLMFGMPDCIVVGIANVDRKRDFTFHSDLKELREKYPTTGHSEAFIRFLEEELQPYIERNYPAGAERYLIGQSLGGLLATEILLKKPRLFTHYLIVSPSLWWDDESLLKQAPALLAQQTELPRYVYISVGKKEDNIMRREAAALRDLLQKTKRKDLKVDFMEMPDDNHATILHGAIYEAFKRLFPFRE
ncbi:MAG: alpha/beta hydrolase-fold protein [Saprospiraceae bacterium]|nr:alpha/beta hydrolase-fold protein [Saprospiraceae bacterium]HNL40160.1 alpha/beta hydrolase-fold protein [Saprospiraceae bacterium]